MERRVRVSNQEFGWEHTSLIRLDFDGGVYDERQVPQAEIEADHIKRAIVRYSTETADHTIHYYKQAPLNDTQRTLVEDMAQRTNGSVEWIA